jgi:hypothetical protein
MHHRKMYLDLSTIGTASQSSDYNWTARNVVLTADLAISGFIKLVFDALTIMDTV